MKACTARVFRSHSSGKTAQWLARSIRDSWGVLWLVIRLLSVRADVSSSVSCTAFPSTLVNMLELSPPLLVLLLLRVGGLSRRNTARVFRSDSPGKAAFSASRGLKFSYKSIFPCTAFPSTLVSMLELYPPLPVLLLLRVGGLSRINTARVFKSDSPGKAAQWLARSIRESWGVLWLVIWLLSVWADVSSSVIKAFFLVLHSPPHLSACWSSPHHHPYFSYSASEDCHV
jgi:hypothetical protein